MDFSSIGATPAKTGQIDFSAIGGIPAVGQDEPTDNTTALGAVGRGAVGMLPLGNQAYSAIAGAAEKKPYLQERQELEKEIKSDITSHEPSRLAGQAAGIAAPALLTGGAFTPESLAEAAGQGAAVGAGFGAGNAIDTLASGGSGAKAAGDVALGAGLGAAGGAVGQKLAGAAESAIPGIETYAAKKAASAVGMGSDELGRMPEQEITQLGQMLLDKGIVKKGASTQEMFNAAKALHESYGAKIGQIGNQATELGLTTDTKPMLDALDEKLNAASELRNPDARKAAVSYKAGMADIMMMANRNGAERVAPDILTEQPPSFITFDQLQQLKKSYGNSAFENGAVKNPAAADVYSQLSAGQKAIVDKASNNADLPADLKAAMSGYSKLYPVVEGVQDVLGRERAGNMPAKGFGMMGKLVGQMPGQSDPKINALTAMGLLGAGHPMWAMGAATATLQNPRAMSTMAQGVANAIPGIAEKLPLVGAQIGGAAAASQQNMGETKPVHSSTNMSTPNSPTSLNVNHPALAPWKSAFDKNVTNAKDAGEVQKSQAVTDFILSQRDPAYAAAKQKAADEPVPTSPIVAAGLPGVPALSGVQKNNMANGGVVTSPPYTSPDGTTTGEGTKSFAQPKEGFGSTLQGLADQLKNPTHEAPAPEPEKLPSTATQRFHQPFNPDFADKLKDFMDRQRGKTNANSR